MRHPSPWLGDAPPGGSFAEGAEAQVRSRTVRPLLGHGEEAAPRGRGQGPLFPHLQRCLWGVPGGGTEAGGQQLTFGEHVRVPRAELDTGCVISSNFPKRKGAVLKFKPLGMIPQPNLRDRKLSSSEQAT